MKKKGFLLEVVFILLLLTILSGCQWFSDNPMFPQAKFMVTSEPTHLTPESEDTRRVTVNFQPINKVGAVFSKCTIVYKKPDGTTISSLTRSLALNLTVYDPNWSASGASIVETEPTSVTIEILDIKTEGYLKNNKIPLAIAELTFFGEDLAGHPLELSTEVFVQPFEGLIEQEDITIYIYCLPPENEEDTSASLENGSTCNTCGGSATSGGEAYMVVDIKDPQLVSKVEYSIDGKSAGSSTAPPFVSRRVSVTSCDGILAQAVIYDIFGNYTVITEKYEGESGGENGQEEGS
ncbi:MAG: hypothetical protein PWP57_1123 [Candidatus Atribacteria bacterium]|nr:hypothetical protein [Candidatus Atribacteria bacterium]